MTMILGPMILPLKCVYVALDCPSLMLLNPVIKLAILLSMFPWALFFF